MTFNKNFISKFIDENRPCAALGLVEIAAQEKGFLAIKPEKPFSGSTGQNGFDLGSELLGNSTVAVLHLVLNFDDDHIYDVFLDLNSPVVKKVLKVWEKTGDYFFFVFGENSFTAFDQTLGEAWYQDNYFGIIEEAKNTLSQYQAVINSIKNTDMVHGDYLDFVFQNEVEFLDLSEHRFEVKSGQGRSV